MSLAPPAPHRRRRVAAWGFGISVAAQLALIVLGIAFLSTPAIKPALALLLAWCVVGSIYVVAVSSVLAAASHWAETDEPPLVMELRVPARAVSVAATVLASAVGIAATVQHLFFLDPRADADNFHLSLVGVWAMILAWMLLHWGFAQLYLQQYYRSTDRPLRFPGTASPGILEFAYFSYTVAVSLAASDVEVRDRRMRWRVLTHSVVGFFFNALILVTAFGAIGDLGRLS